MNNIVNYDKNIEQIQFIHEKCEYYTTLDNLQLNNNFSVIHLNMRSIKNKRDEFLDFLVRSKIQWDVICISETWLKEDIIKYFDIEEYNLFASCRQESEGGGTAIYVHTKHDVMERKDFESKEFETNFIQLKVATKLGVKSILVGEIYRPPNSNNNIFMSFMEKILDTIRQEGKFAVLTGDFNYNLLPDQQNKHAKDFANLMTSYGYFPIISKATRKQNQSESLLDNIFLNNLSDYHTSGIFVEDLSDHLPVFVSLNFAKANQQIRENVIVFNKQKMPELNDFLVGRLENFQRNNDANAASEQLMEAYTEGIKSFSKIYKPCRRKSSIKPWITPSILCSINTKTKLYNKYIRRSNLENESKYKRYRNVLVQTIRNAKRLYFKHAFIQYKQDGKMTWSLLNEAMHKSNKKPIYFPDTFHDNHGQNYTRSEVPDGFNDFFSTIGQMLENEIPKADKDPLSYLNEPASQHCTIIPEVTSNQVENIIKSMNNVGGGIYKINTQILLGTYKSILHHITFFFNLCIRNAIFPDNLKIAVITPLFKSGKRDMFSNYRPISLLPTFSKILEKIIFQTLSSYLDTHKILYPFQFGFRVNHSTFMPIVHMYDQITRNLEAREITCTIYLDLKKAFDTVSIDILLKKLDFIGIKGNLLDIIKSYLSNRQQMTKVQNQYSKKRPVVLGVPQGSILGPLLFILYVNDIFNVSNLAHFYLFADDTAIMIKGKSTEQLQCNINQLVPLISKWFQSNRLSLNASKTYYQIYSGKGVPDLNVQLNRFKIERKKCIKYLGIHFDENLKWHSHISNVEKNISRNLGIMGRVKHLLTSRELLILYNALILPYLNYCAMVWGRNYLSSVKRIIVLQKRAMRIIDKKPYLYPTNELFIKHHILKFPDIVREQIIMVLLAYINKNLPDPVAKMFEYQKPLRTRQPNHFIIPRVRSNYRMFSLSYSAPKMWCTLVGSIFKHINEVPRDKGTLKKHIRKHIFKEYCNVTK